MINRFSLRRLAHYLFILLLGTVTTFLLPSLGSLADELSPTDRVPVPSLMAKVPLSGESFVAAAVARTGDAVVRIDTETVVTRRVDPLFEDPFFRDFFGGSFAPPSELERKIVGQGSGFIIDHSGVILTNAHVVDNANKVTVTLKDGRIFKGEVKGVDEITDLAVVKINTQGSDLPIAPLGDFSTVQVGDWAIAANPPAFKDCKRSLSVISIDDWFSKLPH
jgi:S1-C subfamily serine protease